MALQKILPEARLELRRDRAHLARPPRLLRAQPAVRDVRAQRPIARSPNVARPTGIPRSVRYIDRRSRHGSGRSQPLHPGIASRPSGPTPSTRSSRWASRSASSMCAPKASTREAHIPGSILLPLHELPSRVAEVPNGGMPVAVVAEHGHRSSSACSFLAEHGYHHLFNLDGGIDAVARPAGGRHQRPAPPAPAHRADAVARGQLPLPAQGPRARHRDGERPERDLPRHARVRRGRRRRRPRRRRAWRAPPRAASTRRSAPSSATSRTARTSSRWRRTTSSSCSTSSTGRCFRDIKDGLKPGGVVVFQTYLEEQIRFGEPRNPAHLLKAGELASVFSDFEILRVNERVDSAVPGGPPCALAGIVAKKPAVAATMPRHAGSSAQTPGLSASRRRVLSRRPCFRCTCSRPATASW